MVETAEVAAIYRALPFGMREAICRDIGELAQEVDRALYEYTTHHMNIVRKVDTWLKTVSNHTKPSMRANRDAAIVRSILLEHLIENPLSYVLLDTIVSMIRHEYGVYTALCPNDRIRAIVLTNYPTDEYAEGAGVTGYELTHRKGN